MNWFTRKHKAKPAPVAVEVLSQMPAPMTPAPLAPPAAVVPHVAEERGRGTLGLTGYAPRVLASKSRVRCEACKQFVFAGVRHICLWNAHHHIDSLTVAERTKLIADLQALGVTGEPKIAANTGVKPNGKQRANPDRPNRGRHHSRGRS